jgi:hypothetical protein
MEVGRLFTTYTELEQAIDNLANEHGFDFIIRQSRISKNTEERISGTFKCQHGSRYEGKKKHHTTQKIGCPVFVRFNYGKKIKQYKITKISLLHNHDTNGMFLNHLVCIIL